MKRIDRFFSTFRRGFSRLMLSSVVLPATLTPVAGPGHPLLSVLSLPKNAEIARDTAFGQGASGAYYFLSPSHPDRLARLSVEHPMGAKDLWRESWSTVTLPPMTDFRVRSAAIGLGHLFLGGERKRGGAVVRSFQIGLDDRGGKASMTLTGLVDFFPDAADVSIRLLFLDRKARILWLGYDSGRVESGLPFVALHDRILWSDPSGYIPFPSETDLAAGPPPLLLPRASLSGGRSCFSCRFYLTGRLRPSGGEIDNLPVRSPRTVGSSMGILPAGQGMGIFLDRRSFLCRIPEVGSPSGISGCRRLIGAALPVAAVWWGNRLVYLFPPGTLDTAHGSRWTIASINPAEIYASVLEKSARTPLDLSSLIRDKGELVFLPEGAHPRKDTLSAFGSDLILFGKSHLYRLMAGS